MRASRANETGRSSISGNNVFGSWPDCEPPCLVVRAHNAGGTPACERELFASNTFSVVWTAKNLPALSCRERAVARKNKTSARVVARAWVSCGVVRAARVRVSYGAERAARAFYLCEGERAGRGGRTFDTLNFAISEVLTDTMCPECDLSTWDMRIGFRDSAFRTEHDLRTCSLDSVRAMLRWLCSCLMRCGCRPGIGTFRPCPTSANQRTAAATAAAAEKVNTKIKYIHASCACRGALV